LGQRENDDTISRLLQIIGFFCKRALQKWRYSAQGIYDCKEPTNRSLVLHSCEWVMSDTWKSHVSHVDESCLTCECVMSHMWKSHVPHVNESCHDLLVGHDVLWMWQNVHEHRGGRWKKESCLTCESCHIICLRAGGGGGS